MHAYGYWITFFLGVVFGWMEFFFFSQWFCVRFFFGGGIGGGGLDGKMELYKIENRGGKKREKLYWYLGLVELG